MTNDMTKGRILPQLTAFAVPLILGNLFQILYNAADSMIVGRFVGDGALAAVGTAGPIMNMVILFISGMCMGAGILMSTLFGAKKMEKLMGKKDFTQILGGLITKPQGKPTLVPDTDKRPAINVSAKNEFDEIKGDF